MKTPSALAAALLIAGTAAAQDAAPPADPAAAAPSTAFEIGRRAGETQAAQARARALARSRASARQRAALQQDLTRSTMVTPQGDADAATATATATASRPAYSVADNPPVNGPVPSPFIGGLRTPWDPR